MRSFGKLAVMVGTLLLAPSGTSADIVVDQSYDPGPGGGYFVSSVSTYAQLFKAGLSGQVAGIDVRAYNYFGATTAPLQLDLWTVGGAYPESLVSNLASASIPQSLVPSSSGFVSFDLSSSGASFSAGQTYAIVLSTASNNSYVWEGPSNGMYANGSGRLVSSGHVYYTPAGQDFDFGFKTYAVSVPEPSAAALVTLALAAAGVGSIMTAITRRKPSGALHHGTAF